MTGDVGYAGNMTDMTAGLSLKPVYFEDALHCHAPGMWWEVHPENYMAEGGPRLPWLLAVRERHPVSLHGVSLSLAADAPPCAEQLQRLARLVREVQPALVSEHLAWSQWQGVYHPDLLPFPRTQESLQRVVDNVLRTQDALQRTIAIENPAHYLPLPGHTMDEPEFMQRLVQQTGCTLLLDVNNLYLGASNLGHDPAHGLDYYPLHAVSEIHLAGHHADPALGAGLLIDGHDTPVAEPVWALYQQVLQRTGPRPTLIERDEQLPPFAELMAERQRAHHLLRHCPELAPCN